jgi:DNA transposition AAA+ family ATPase
MNTALTTKTKDSIVEALQQYINEHKISQAELARQIEISPAYLSTILNCKYYTKVNDKNQPIPDSWFIKIAQQVGFSISKEYWFTIPTVQFMQMISTLKNAKETGATAMIIGTSGYGKTKAIDQFVKNSPDCTYRITVSSLYRLYDIVNELGEKVGLQDMNLTRSNGSSLKIRVDRIVKKLKEVKAQGKKPVIIFDEAENLEASVLKMIKGLYDALQGNCSIVMIGTEQLVVKLLNSKKRQRDGIPQLYRRFKAGLVQLSRTLDFDAFFKKLGITDKGLQNLLYELCENYGELHDYLEPTIIEADQKKVPVTEELFRLKFNMPKASKK